MNISNENALVCKGIRFLSELDKIVFFEWLNKIVCIGKYEIDGDVLFFCVTEKVISDTCLDDLIAIFFRYDIEGMDQLSRFLTEENKSWFFDNKQAFWHKKVFGR